MKESFGGFVEISDVNGGMYSSDLDSFVCVTELAFKALISPETKDRFVNKSFVQIKLTDEQIVNKLKNYSIDLENKDFRIIKPIFNSKSYEFRNQVNGVALLKEIKDNKLIWG